MYTDSPHGPATAEARPAPAASTLKIRVAGIVLALGASAWGTGVIIAGDQGKKLSKLEEVTGIGYLAGLLALAWVLRHTRATGDRKGRFAPFVLMALLPLAAAFNVYSLVALKSFDDPTPAWFPVLDASWPLSQLVLLILGIMTAVVGRFRGALRWHPLACGLWLIVAMGAQASVGMDASARIGGGWLILVTGGLGLHLALRPRNTLGEDGGR
ncbi:hypothetical protein [Actinomadura macrotermitis]|uniref:Uncharacterized protein n=1 Tax=Actinomadura macrotermitis TaxID=2585200 RepID=A0A7K0C837_9ACTN|nr:hypothetical protein [Actinomadura macrotermitis]MQY08964.1 hypothetical protein [Actinomadura macrotermitis]